MKAGKPGNCKSKSSSSVASAGLVCNGFPAIQEGEALKVDESRVAPFTLPSEALWHTPKPEEVICSFKNGDKERKIHNNIELDSTECDNIAKMQAEARSQGLEFYPSVSAMASRYLSRARGDAKKAVKLMQATQEWRTEYFKDGPVSDEQVVEDMQHGIIYFGGRDSSLRPTVVVRAARIPQKWYKDKSIDKLIRILVFCMEYMIRYMVVPGKVECNNLIVDLKGISASQVPISALKDIYSVMSHHYIGRVFKFYIVNLSSTLSMIASLAKNLLTDRQKQKLNFIEDVKQLREAFALHQLEEDLGGARPIVKEFFPFPLVPGPYHAGFAKGADENAVPYAYRCLTKAGARGRVWNPKLSVQENSRLEYSLAALEIFERCGQSLPPELQEKKQQADAARKAEAAAQAAAEAAKLAAAENNKENKEEEQKLDEEDAKKSSVGSATETTRQGSMFDSHQVGMDMSAEDLDEDLDLMQEEGEAENDDKNQDPVEIQGPEDVAPAGFFSCRLCRCSP